MDEHLQNIYASCSRDTIKVLRSIKNKKKVKCTMFISPCIGGTIHRIGLHASICSRFFEPTYDHQKPTYVYHSILSTSGNLHSLNHTHRSQWWSNSYGQVGTRVAVLLIWTGCKLQARRRNGASWRSMGTWAGNLLGPKLCAAGPNQGKKGFPF
jgi:hypothetical protein